MASALSAGDDGCVSLHPPDHVPGGPTVCEISVSCSGGPLPVMGPVLSAQCRPSFRMREIRGPTYRVQSDRVPGTYCTRNEPRGGQLSASPAWACHESRRPPKRGGFRISHSSPRGPALIAFGRVVLCSLGGRSRSGHRQPGSLPRAICDNLLSSALLDLARCGAMGVVS